MPTRLLILLLVFAGCNNASQPHIPPAANDFVKNDHGVGTARVFGIEFQVNVDSGGVSTESSFNADFLRPEESTSRKRFALGDDISIQLDSIDESTVHFFFNDRDFGTLNVGDKVEIDDQRNVTVNGIARPALAND